MPLSSRKQFFLSKFLVIFHVNYDTIPQKVFWQCFTLRLFETFQWLPMDRKWAHLLSIGRAIGCILTSKK